MKRIILKSAVIALTTFYFPTFANVALQQYQPLSWLDTSQKISDKQLEQVLVEYKERKALFDQYKEDEQKLFDLIVDQELVKQGYRLWLEVDKGINNHKISNQFAGVGIAPSEFQSFSFDINYQQNPHLIKPSDMFGSFVYANAEYEHSALSQRGFRPSDLELLSSFIKKTNPNHRIIRWRLNRIKYYLGPKLKVMAAKKDEIAIKEVGAMIERKNLEGRYHEERLWCEWSKELLEVFDLPRQRILQSYLVEKQPRLSIISPSIRKDKLDGYKKAIAQIKSGEFDKIIAQKLARVMEDSND